MHGWAMQCSVQAGVEIPRGNCVWEADSDAEEGGGRRG